MQLFDFNQFFTNEEQQKIQMRKKDEKTISKIDRKKKENEMKIPFLKLKGNQMNFFFLLAHAVI